jgi:hypothetical protein
MIKKITYIRLCLPLLQQAGANNENLNIIMVKSNQ